ncbi:hypothetical protein KA119_02770 [Candidatus Gracilibacteria bacterium]|nr:hypothetical protein [Candidatus Gracilibacteria bacterium]
MLTKSLKFGLTPPLTLNNTEGESIQERKIDLHTSRGVRTIQCEVALATSTIVMSAGQINPYKIIVTATPKGSDSTEVWTGVYNPQTNEGYLGIHHITSDQSSIVWYCNEKEGRTWDEVEVAEMDSQVTLISNSDLTAVYSIDFRDPKNPRITKHSAEYMYPDGTITTEQPPLDLETLN